MVESSICAIPYGAVQIREALRQNLSKTNNGLHSLHSPVEQLILRYAFENACYVATDYEAEVKKVEANENAVNVTIHISNYDPLPEMTTKFTVSSSLSSLFHPRLTRLVLLPRRVSSSRSAGVWTRRASTNSSSTPSNPRPSTAEEPYSGVFSPSQEESETETFTWLEALLFCQVLLRDSKWNYRSLSPRVFMRRQESLTFFQGCRFTSLPGDTMPPSSEPK